MEGQGSSALQPLVAREDKKPMGPQLRIGTGIKAALLLSVLLLLGATISTWTREGGLKGDTSQSCATANVLGRQARLCVGRVVKVEAASTSPTTVTDERTIGNAGFPGNVTAPGGDAPAPPSFDRPKPHFESVVTSSASLSAFQRQRQRQRGSPAAPLSAGSPLGVRQSQSGNTSAMQQVALGSPPASQQQAPKNATWRTLTEFIQLCDNYLPSKGSHEPSQPRQPYARNYSSPQTLGELLGLGEASQGSPRNVSRVVQALHDITVAERKFSVMTEEELEALDRHGCNTEPTRPHDKKTGEPPRIGILMVSSGAPGYVRLSELNKQRYAELHRYELHILPPADSSRHPAWSKIPAALSLLPLYDWMWLVDADTLVMTPSVPLTNFINDSYEMVLTRDCNNINTGSWLIRNSQWTEAMLAAIYARPDAEPRAWWEQAALIQLAGLPGVKGRIKVLPTNKGPNSYGAGTSCKDQGLFSAGDLLVHFPGAKDKEAAFQEYWQQLPVQERQPLPSR